MFSLNSEKVFISLPWCGCLVPVTTITVEATTLRKALTIVFRVAEVGDLHLVQTTYKIEYASGLIVKWVEEWIKCNATPIRTLARRNVGTTNATPQRELAPLTH